MYTDNTLLNNIYDLLCVLMESIGEQEVRHIDAY